MKLLDRIALQRIVILMLSFILSIIKLFAPKPTEDAKKPEDDKKIWRPRWRKK